MRFANNPMVHFLVLGGLLYWFMSGGGDDRIEINHLQLESARQAMQASLGLPTLTDAQRLEADLRVIEDQLLYREALAMGLDRGDHIVRQRMVQKLLFLAEDAATTLDDEQILIDYYAEHPDDFIEPARVSFTHVYLRVADTQKQAQITATLQRDPESAAKLGDHFPLPRTVVAASMAEVRENFGVGFAESLDSGPAEGWFGPVTSGFGLHFVRIGERAPARRLSFEESRSRLEAQIRQSEKTRAHRELTERLAKRYQVALAPGADETYLKGLNQALEQIRARGEQP
jgi:peptidyl-prolyl cis-trans isomerase C